MMEYMDDVLGRLFDYLEQSLLKQKTYVMIMSDNGSELFLGEIGSKIVSLLVIVHSDMPSTCKFLSTVLSATCMACCNAGNNCCAISTV